MDFLDIWAAMTIDITCRNLAQTCSPHLDVHSPFVQKKKKTQLKSNFYFDHRKLTASIYIFSKIKNLSLEIILWFFIRILSGLFSGWPFILGQPHQGDLWHQRKEQSGFRAAITGKKTRDCISWSWNDVSSWWGLNEVGELSRPSVTLRRRRELFFLMPRSHWPTSSGCSTKGYYICPSALRALRAIKFDTGRPRWGRGWGWGWGAADFIALLSPLCATGESSIKVCGLIKFTAVRLKRQLVLTAHLVAHVRGEGGAAN